MAMLRMGLSKKYPKFALIKFSGNFANPNEAADVLINRWQYFYSAGKKVYLKDHAAERMWMNGDWEFIPDENQPLQRMCGC